MCMGTLGGALSALGRHPEAFDTLNESIRIIRGLGNVRIEANSFYELGAAYMAVADYAHAHEALTKALALHTESGDVQGVALILNRLGTLAIAQGDEAAVRHHTEALTIARRIGTPREEADALAGLGRVYLEDRPDDATALLRQALELYRSIGMPRAVERVQDQLTMLSHTASP